MRVKALRVFHDNEAGRFRERGIEFDASDERGAYLASLGLVKQLEEPAAEKPKPARKRAARKPKE